MLSISPDKLSFIEDGKSFTMRGFKDFPLLGRLMNEGELPVAQIMKDRKSVGANIIEVLGMWTLWPGLAPSNPKFWDSLFPLAHIAKNEGLKLLITVFADAQVIMPDEASQIAHWNRLLTHLGGEDHVLFMVSNQGDKNGVPYSSRIKFNKVFPHQICCRDNPMESANPTMPPMDFSGYCSSRDDIKGFVEVGSSMWYVVNGWGVPQWTGTQQVSVLTEPIGASETYQPGRRWNDAGKFRQLARSLTFKGTGGAFFHSDAGIQSALLDSTRPIQRACAVEYLGNIPNA